MHNFLTEATIRRVAAVCALFSLVFAMGMAFEYGRAMSWLHAGTLALLAIAVPLAFVGADIVRAYGRRITAGLLVAAGTLMSVGEYGTHFGYTVGSRVTDAQQTSVQNTAWKAVQDNRDSERANREMWVNQLSGLNAERKALLESNPWIATVKPDGLKAELATLRDRIDAEIKTGREGRRSGCGRECERLQNAAVDLEKRIASAEKATDLDVKIDDLTKRIEATQRILDRKVETAGKTEFRSSKIVNQTQGFAQIAVWDDHPSESAMSWTQLVLGAVIAFITTYLTLVFTTVAFGGVVQQIKDKAKGAGRAAVETEEHATGTAVHDVSKASVAAAAPYQLPHVSPAGMPAPVAQVYAAPTASGQFDFKIEDNRSARELLARLEQALRPHVTA